MTDMGQGCLVMVFNSCMNLFSRPPGRFETPCTFLRWSWYDIAGFMCLWFTNKSYRFVGFIDNHKREVQSVAMTVLMNMTKIKKWPQSWFFVNNSLSGRRDLSLVPIHDGKICPNFCASGYCSVRSCRPGLMWIGESSDMDRRTGLLLQSNFPRVLSFVNNSSLGMISTSGVTGNLSTTIFTIFWCSLTIKMVRQPSVTLSP